MRAECGLPSFNPQGLDMVNGIDVYTIEYDDADVDAIIVDANDTLPTIPDPTSTNNTKMVPKIPLPKKQENFDGKKKNQTQKEAYLLRFEKNTTLGTTTYFYSNGTSFTYDTTETVTFNSPSDTRSYEVRYPSGTNVTVNKDGSKVIKAPGQNPSYIAAPAPPPPAPITPPPSAYDYETNLNDGTTFGGRRVLQSLPPQPSPPPTTSTTNTTTNTTTPPPTTSPPTTSTTNTTTNTTTPPPMAPPSTTSTNTTSTTNTTTTTPPPPAPVPAPPAPAPVGPPPAPPGTQTVVNVYVPPTPAAPTQSSVTPVTPQQFNIIAPIAPPTP
jgi:hypothetical protein